MFADLTLKEEGLDGRFTRSPKGTKNCLFFNGNRVGE